MLMKYFFIIIGDEIDNKMQLHVLSQPLSSFEYIGLEK